MLEINSSLLDSFNTELRTPDSFAACLNQRGLYNSAHFVLRLSPVNHELLESGAEKDPKDITWDEIQAYSTYIHETVHWWQHIGSTSGLVMSMCYPGQTHANIKFLRELASSGKVGKSIKAWAEAKMIGGVDHSDALVASANSVVNNVMDLEFFRALILNPERLRDMVKNKYFESVGHSFNITYSILLQVLETTFGGEDLPFLPRYNKWVGVIKDLAEREVGFYHYGSDIILPPISGLSLLEGQARFIQLQFLEFASFKFDRPLKLEDYARQGYLDDVYGEAFKYFISSTDSEFPSSVDDPLVGLFLLVCDLSLNPGVGFPFDITDFERFPLEANPSIRFAVFCNAVKNDCSHLKTYLKDYSRDEYFYASSELAQSCGYHSPREILDELNKWVDKEPTMHALMKEQKIFDFNKENQPVRVIFSHFLKFSQDKLEVPEFFCWSGRFRHTHADARYNEIWLRNLSLFTDKADDNGIYPRLREGVNHENLMNTLNNFYGNSINYDLTRQWTLHDGIFKYDFAWLTEKFTQDEVRDKAKWLFENLYGISPDDLEKIKP